MKNLKRKPRPSLKKKNKEKYIMYNGVKLIVDDTAPDFIPLFTVDTFKNE